ncbi:GGDEF domain-containing protein [Alteromonas sp. ASW11-130]|uniref:GGDEF domain-containing protein n=1 Tax=Alteromonas sp. ASW11-130 TaxID=3015775 RepID=UPI00224215B5|nr:GGDEF domain-containing protein [Alteromonas sp. ASW11-130]MCW8091684.1 GGDEF domain-containing protein [Alteromonas sp. ASW11-130]
MEEKNLQSLKQHSELLAQFIIRLSKFYEGFSPDIDTELQKLRGHLSGRPDFTLAAVSVNKLNKTLRLADLTVRKYTADSLSQLEEAVKKLQHSLIGEPALTKESAQILISLNQPVQSLFVLQSLCNKVLGLFQHATKADSEKNHEASSSASSTLALQKAILDELSQLIETYANKNPNDDQLSLLRTKLKKGMTEDELLQSCVAIIRMVVKDSLSEASLSGKVIQSLHNALGDIQENVSQSIERSQSNFEARQFSHREIKAKLDSIEDQLRQAESLEKLKKQAQSYLASMASTLYEREEVEQKEQAELMTLLSAMQSQLVNLQKQTQHYRKKLAEQIVSTQTDALTKLGNRKAYDERVEKECQRAIDTKDPLALAVVDIDYFKSINDKFGHAAGDKTLQIVGKHLKTSIQPSDFIARWGGEEFVLLFPATDGTQLLEKLEKIRVSLSKLPLKFRQEKISLTASFGGTCYRQGESPSAMFERADRLLYQAKHSGRNCVMIDQEFN